ncbi:hypothetical protein LNKW23_35700 [Paralimibaculum aggregatum]|uniref:Glycosyltransferase 2-like domain-containing protein n=1 Tax=Paralimibaculum aggregatum TaxID=3036245 RepID=A0ABQ6LS24_9RHOB|nr:glycosyltransferase [Limibaculum sp. NKW23]GMG84355.1 hypothetical protein LNKW23_35700 [Limibaculum sp. NKW23]
MAEERDAGAPGAGAREAVDPDPVAGPVAAPGGALPAYDAVMATRNRPEAVALSLPLLRGQTVPPKRVVIVDASDDPAPVAALVAGANAGPGPEVMLLRAAASSSAQRNRGLEALEAAGGAAEVVLFPDDDSLLYPDAMAEILAVYARDPGIAAVCAAEARVPPPGVDLGAAYVAPPPGRLRRTAQRLRQRVTEAAAGANPFLAIGRRLGGQHPPPGWLGERGTVAVPYMTGFRMSFRRAALARGGAVPDGFDETLTRYAWFEDIEASFAAMAHGPVLGAERALIYHHRFPGRRGDGFPVGLWSVLNRAYVAMRHVRANPALFPRPGREAWRLRLYLAGRAAAYRLMARDDWSRARARGAAAGLRHVGPLLAPETPEEGLSARYRGLMGRLAPEAGPPRLPEG